MNQTVAKYARAALTLALGGLLWIGCGGKEDKNQELTGFTSRTSPDRRGKAEAGAQQPSAGYQPTASGSRQAWLLSDSESSLRSG